MQWKIIFVGKKYYKKTVSLLSVLSAYSYVTWFQILNLLTCYLSLWITMQPQHKHHQHPDRNPAQLEGLSNFSLGHGRFEVLAIFASTILAQLAAMFVMKEAVERILDTPDIHT